MKTTIEYEGIAIGTKVFYTGNVDAGVEEVTVTGVCVRKDKDGSLKAFWYDFMDADGAEGSADDDELFEAYEEAAKDAHKYAKRRIGSLKEEVGERMLVIAKIEADYYKRTGKELKYEETKEEP